ncbi:PKD domain-containing protein [Solicola sp. PLA-1-18]|uniref:PKD domain-containing protein n=1 Tax=Solicola sp. PLA-1-18 TaxID=3380532 RepID=UPI003B7F8BC6
MPNLRRTATALTALLLTAGGLATADLGRTAAPAAVDAAAVAGTVSFTASGDIAAGTNSSATLNRVRELAPDLHLAVGDLSYGATGAEQQWCDFVKARVGQGFAFELVSGNHESNGQNGNINDFSACLPNQLPGAVGTYGRQYYVDVPREDPVVRFVMISPGITYPSGLQTYASGTPEYAWTAAAIDGARAAQVPWVVVGTHMPCLTIGVYACPAGPDITNLLVQKKVDLVLNGHEHMYQRTKQLALGTGCTAIVPATYTPACVADAGSALRKGAGTVIATVGTGGQTYRDANPDDPEAPYFATYSALNADPTWGNLLVRATATRLSASFDRAAGGTFADAFTIDQDATPTNQPPAASFTSSCAALDCTFDGRGSSDTDGTIASYAWDFGDGDSGTGAMPSHTYAGAGTYTARLTVTDDDGATGTTTRTVTVAAGATPIAQDGFGRTVANGLGTADVGGAWTVSGTASRYAVSGGAGRLTFPTPGLTLSGMLNQVSTTTADLSLSLSTDKAVTGSGLYTDVVGRRNAGGTYAAPVVVTANGAVTVRLVRVVGSTTTVLATPVSTGVTYAPGDRLLVRLRVTGTSPTTLQARVWKAGTTEPTAWQRTATDSTAALQAPGAVGVSSYLSSSATNAPLVLSLDDVLVAAP